MRVGRWYVQHTAIWHWYLLLCIYIILKIFFTASVHSFFILKKCSTVKSTEWSTTPACPSLGCFFNRGDIEGTNSSKILCLMFVYVFHVNLCQD